MGVSSNEFKAFVLDQLCDIPELSSGPFFGGTGLRSGAVFFGMIMDGTLFFTTDDRSRPTYEKLGAKCFAYEKQGRMQSTRLFEVPAEVLDDQERLAAFATEAIAVAKAKRSSKTSPSAKRPRKTAARTSTRRS